MCQEEMANQPLLVVLMRVSHAGFTSDTFSCQQTRQDILTCQFGVFTKHRNIILRLSRHGRVLGLKIDTAISLSNIFYS